jgi:hypothetical protein
VRARSASSVSYVMFLSHATMRIVLAEERRGAEHINIAEGLAVLRWLQRLSRCRSSWEARVVVIVDSRVIKGAMDKGRSPSFTINRVIRRVASLALTAGWWLELFFTPSEFNIADLPSRHKQINTGEANTVHQSYLDRLSTIRDLGTSRQRGPPLRLLGRQVHQPY